MGRDYRYDWLGILKPIAAFTTEELKALADFYGSPVGKSAMQKFGAYMADLMPTMEAEITKAQAKANQSLPNQSPR